MKKGNEDFPVVTMTFIFIIFLNIVAPLFGMQKGVAIMVVLFWEFLVLVIVVPFMAYHKRDLPVVILPVTISLLWVIMSLFGKQEERTMVQINFLDSTAVALIAGICGILGTLIVTLWKTWKDSKTIDSVKECAGDIKAEVKSARGSELKNIESHTSDIRENMLLKVLPGMEKLNSISGFVTRIDINTQNSGGDIKLIFSEVSKMAERIESLKSELETEKRESREREQEYMGQIAVLRAENSQLKDRNKKLELALGRRDRDQDIER